MKKDVNFIFFGILILLLIAMVGVMLYSDYTYHKVNTQYLEFKEKVREAEEDLNQTRAELEVRELKLQEVNQTLADIITELNLSKQKESSLSEFYTSVKSEKEGLEGDLERAEYERDEWRSNYDATQLDLGKCKADYALAQRDIAQYQLNIREYNSSVKEAVEKAETLAKAANSLNCNNKSICIDNRYNVTQLVEDLQAILVGMEL